MYVLPVNKRLPTGEEATDAYIERLKRRFVRDYPERMSIEDLEANVEYLMTHEPSRDLGKPMAY